MSLILLIITWSCLLCGGGIYLFERRYYRKRYNLEMELLMLIKRTDDKWDKRVISDAYEFIHRVYKEDKK